MSEQPSNDHSLPRISSLYQRHPGLTEAQCGGFEEAVRVCLTRHHVPPVDFHLPDGQTPTTLWIEWNPPDDRVQRAWHNMDNTTEYGAYGVAIAALEARFSLFVVERADTRTGADWHLAPDCIIDDLEATYRLEVSGIDRGNYGDLIEKLNEVHTIMCPTQAHAEQPLYEF